MGMVNRKPIANREAPALKTAHIGWMVRLAVSERLRWPDLVLVTLSYVLHLPLSPKRRSLPYGKEWPSRDRLGSERLFLH